MEQEILSVAETSERILTGKMLLLAGEEKLLIQLPEGNWIGGTTPYFIIHGEEAITSRESIFVTDISEISTGMTIEVYDLNQLQTVYQDGCDSTFSFLIIPGMTEIHKGFALCAPSYKKFGARPLIGWVSGVHLDDAGMMIPKVFNGLTGGREEQRAVVMHVTLTDGKTADVGIVNLFEQGDGDILSFACDGFFCHEVEVNGKKENFAAYIKRKNLDTRLPLVADYYGAMVNISFQDVDQETGEVGFYAPVFRGVRYRHARIVADYGQILASQFKSSNLSRKNVLFSCNCILNFTYGTLDGKNTGPFVGPISFGEIAYQLLNQTLVYLQVHDA